MSCNDCVFWYDGVVPPGTENRPQRFRFCRRYPPNIHVTLPTAPGEKKVVNYHWPVVSETDWCGEFRHTDTQQQH